MSEGKKRGGGPNTPEGKARSSQNSRTHGVRSTALLLPGEREEDYDRVAEGWRREYEPEGYQEERLVEVLVKSDWFFQRAERRWMETEASLVKGKGENPLHWTAEERHQLELLQRYKTAAERSFQRALGVMVGLRRDIRREDRDVLKLWFKTQDLRHKAGLPMELPETSEPEVEETESQLPVSGRIVRTITFPVARTGFVSSLPRSEDLDEKQLTDT